jgi:hypothetical protein
LCFLFLYFVHRCHRHAGCACCCLKVCFSDNQSDFGAGDRSSISSKL